MKLPKRTLLVSIILLTLAACEQTGDEYSASGDHNRERIFDYVGKWVYSYSLYYTSEIYISKNGTFTFHDRGCLGHSYANGHWMTRGDTMILTSYDRYDSNYPPGPKTQERTMSSDEDSTLTIELNERVTSRFPGPGDTTKLYFDEVSLVYIRDTLFSADTGSVLKDHHYHRQ